VAGTWGVGVETFGSLGQNTIRQNTVTGNGVSSIAGPETPGVRLFGTGNIVEFNQINANYGAGVLVYSTSAQNRISKNSIFDNGTVPTLAGGSASGQIGIDLLTTADNPTNNTSSTAAKLGITPYVSLNDAGDGDTGGNGVLNYPVITGA